MSVEQTIIIAYLFVGTMLGINGCLMIPGEYKRITEEYKRRGLEIKALRGRCYVYTFLINLFGWPYGVTTWAYRHWIKPWW